MSVTLYNYPQHGCVVYSCMYYVTRASWYTARNMYVNQYVYVELVQIADRSECECSSLWRKTFALGPVGYTAGIARYGAIALR